MTEAHEVRQLGRPPVLDGHDVIAFKAIGDPASRHRTDAVTTRKRGVEMGRDPAADVSHRGDIGASLDDHLGERVAEQVLDGRERHWTDAGDLAKLA